MVGPEHPIGDGQPEEARDGLIARDIRVMHVVKAVQLSPEQAEPRMFRGVLPPLVRLVLNRVPVLIGTGIPLFGPLPADQWLDHVATTSYQGGLVQSEYLVRRSGS